MRSAAEICTGNPSTKDATHTHRHKYKHTLSLAHTHRHMQCHLAGCNYAQPQLELSQLPLARARSPHALSVSLPLSLSVSLSLPLAIELLNCMLATYALPPLPSPLSSLMCALCHDFRARSFTPRHREGATEENLSALCASASCLHP